MMFKLAPPDGLDFESDDKSDDDFVLCKVIVALGVAFNVEAVRWGKFKHKLVILGDIQYNIHNATIKQKAITRYGSGNQARGACHNPL